MIRQNSRRELSQNPSLRASGVGRLPTCGKRACEYINECFQKQKINFEKKENASLMKKIRLSSTRNCAVERRRKTPSKRPPALGQTMHWRVLKKID